MCLDMKTAALIQQPNDLNEKGMEQLFKRMNQRTMLQILNRTITTIAFSH